MSYKSNPQYLPPKKSADEYEREIALLKLQIQEAEETIRLAGTPTWDDGYPAAVASSYFSRKNDIDLYVEEIKKNDNE